MMALPSLLLLVVMVFAPVLSSFFVTDDLLLIYLSSPITTHSLWEYFTSTGGWFNNCYRPIVRLAFLADYLLYHLQPAGYHWTNLLMHLAVTMLAFVFTGILLGDRLVAFLTAAVFSVHPLHTEAVSYISGRGDVIFTCFYLMAAIFFLKYLRRERGGGILYLMASLLCFVLSLLSKESALTLPLILLLTEWLDRGRTEAGAAAGVRWRIYVPYAGVLAAYACLKIFFFPSPVPKPDLGSQALLGIAYSFTQLFAPIDIDRFSLQSIPLLILNLTLLLNLSALLLGWLYLSLNKREVWRLALYCALWIAITVFPLYLGSGARFLYISSIGSAMLMASLFSACIEGARQHGCKVTTLLAGILLISIFATFSVRTIQRNRIYNDAGSIAQGIIAQLRTLAPHPPKASTFYLINFPSDWVRDTETWIKPILEIPAVILTYGDASLVIWTEHRKLLNREEKLRFLETHSFEPCLQGSKACFVFEYQDGKVIESTARYIQSANIAR